MTNLKNFVRATIARGIERAIDQRITEHLDAAMIEEAAQSALDNYDFDEWIVDALCNADAFEAAERAVRRYDVDGYMRKRLDVLFDNDNLADRFEAAMARALQEALADLD